MRHSALLGATLTACAFAPAAFAQQSDTAISQAVVQPLPPAGTEQLNEALRKLARNSRNVDALIDAGTASLRIDDVDAALGFFGRAQELSPDNPRVKVGLAGALVRQQRPIEALRLFDEAQAAGASTASLAGDRAMAYDLVGDNATAARFYQQALARREDSEIRRHLALSHAIAGNKAAFEAVLHPLIEKQDFAAYRTQAFALAILGEEDDAIAIAEAVMPRDLAARMTPYLRYMPRLTKAQQAAAANFGLFPRAAQIGRDSRQIAQYSGGGTGGGADARLTPQGEPLGPRTDSRSPRRRPGSGRSSAAAAPSATEAEAARSVRADRASASDPFARTRSPTRVRVRRDTSSAEPRAEVVAATPVPTPTAEPVQLAENSIVTELPSSDVPSVVVAEAAETVPEQSAPVVVAAIEPQQASSIEQFDPGSASAPDTSDPVSSFDLADAGSAPRSSASVAPTPAPEAQTSAATKPASVADAFASFDLGTAGATPPSGGVDITTIRPPREVENPPKAEPEKPAHPKRYWVQIATGKDRTALKFDWRRISRKASGVLGDVSGYVTPWGQSNRLLAGPFDSAKDARNAVNSLKESGVDSFTFTSPEGQEIDKL